MSDGDYSGQLWLIEALPAPYPTAMLPPSAQVYGTPQASLQVRLMHEIGYASRGHDPYEGRHDPEN